MLDRLFELQATFINDMEYDFTRDLENEIDWSMRLISLQGSRGVGKTTLLLNHIKQHHKNDKTALYVSMDDLYFADNNLLSLAKEFYKKGGKYLFLDEVHKYPNWSREIKNIYDSLTKLRVVFTSSSILEILKGYADLSRRVVMYELVGLSFREFLQIQTKKKFKKFTLEEIVTNHEKIAADIRKQVLPFQYWDDYLEFGYFPFFLENKKFYLQRLTNIINLTIEVDLVQCKNIEVTNIFKLKRLLKFITNSSPYQPNMAKLSGLMDVSRKTLNDQFDYLRDARLLNLLKNEEKAYSPMAKPDKVFLHNTNLMYAIDKTKANEGTLRETFFFNQLQGAKHKVNTPPKGDFLIDEKYVFEIGGKNKTTYQIKNHKNAFVVADDIEIGYGNKIPLWLFGFLY